MLQCPWHVPLTSVVRVKLWAGLGPIATCHRLAGAVRGSQGTSFTWTLLAHAATTSYSPLNRHFQNCPPPPPTPGPPTPGPPRFTVQTVKPSKSSHRTHFLPSETQNMDFMFRDKTQDSLLLGRLLPRTFPTCLH